MAEGARIAAGEGADIIDINMGCPAKKVTGGYSGSALMRDLDHALSLIDAVVGAVDVPVTRQDAARLGRERAQRADAGAPRRSRPACRWSRSMAARAASSTRARPTGARSRAVKEAVSIPVVANGDVAAPADAADDPRAVRRRCRDDRPRQLRRALGRRRRSPRGRGSAALAAPSGREAMADYVVAHYEDMLALYGVESGLRQARKHLGWYLDRHAPHAPPDAARSDHDVAPIPVDGHRRAARCLRRCGGARSDEAGGMNMTAPPHGRRVGPRPRSC